MNGETSKVVKDMMNNDIVKIGGSSLVAVIITLLSVWFSIAQSIPTREEVQAIVDQNQRVIDDAYSAKLPKYTVMRPAL